MVFFPCLKLLGVIEIVLDFVFEMKLSKAIYMDYGWTSNPGLGYDIRFFNKIACAQFSISLLLDEYLPLD